MRRTLPIATLLLIAGAAFADRPSKRQSDKVRGEMLYSQHCVQCHGPTAAGNGPATASLVVPIPDLRGVITAENREQKVEVVLSGKGAMPGFFMTLDRHDARRAVRHMMRVGPEGAPDFPEPDAEIPEGDDGEEEGTEQLPDDDEQGEAGQELDEAGASTPSATPEGSEE